VDRPKRLILLACTATKRADPDPLIAIRRYDGPSFRTLRKWQATNPTAAELLDIHILSAQLGLITADTLISDYNQRMTPNRAAELRQSVCSALAHIVAQQGAYTPFGAVTFTAGGIGTRLGQIKAWLNDEMQLPST
jgi:hypothetical protein